MSNPGKEKPCALVLGHSFVSRFKVFLKREEFSKNLNLDDTCRVFFSGIGGRTVEKIMRFDLEKLYVLQPQIVILEIGSNDLCDVAVDPEAIGSQIMTLINRLRYEFGVERVVVCQILYRQNQPYPQYNSSVTALNSWLKVKLSNVQYATLWRHRGLVRPSLDIYGRDGIHLNRRGEALLFRSYRGAILFALKHLQP